MGSPCEIQLQGLAPRQAGAIAERAVAEVERLEALYSRYRDDSLLSRINRVAAAGGEIAVDDETAGLLDYAATCHAQSGGLFDITSGVLRRAWGRFDANTLPDHGRIEALLAIVGWEKLAWMRPVLAFPRPGMEIDFGGVVKEYAVDRVAALCLEAGAGNGVVNLGGDIRVIGPRADGTAWRVGVRHPRDREGVVSSLLIRQGALASSGDYERRIVLDGVTYGHILNPRTGWPVRRMAAVSVLADLCVVAGSAATIAMLQEDAGAGWLARLGLPHLWVAVDGKAGGPLLRELVRR
jgi:thiamine biosynthesis lipoprotein